jgi:hypothetical protein
MNEAQIRKAAYHLWESQGKPHGLDLEHWLQAKDSANAEALSDGLAGSVSSSVAPPAPLPKKRASKKTVTVKPAIKK